MELWQAITLAIIEGLTEYLPISSTGHLIVTSALLGINNNEFVKDYTVMVQFGAIMSVVFLYWRRFLQGSAVYFRMIVAFLPAALVGFMVKDAIDRLLGDVMVVAVAFIVGGVILILADQWFSKKEQIGEVGQITIKSSLVIGLFQCVAFIPGVSRSAATIFGGLIERLDRKTAAEFSFLLAVPTLTAAGGYKLLKIIPTIQASQVNELIVGNIVSFIVGTITIKAFIGYLSRAGFRLFGIYRIVVGIIIIILLKTGHGLQMM